MNRWAAITGLCLYAGFPATAGEPISGPAQVIDGDTLVVQERRIDLYGIDAPEPDQTCTWPNKIIRCGNMARTALLDLIAVTPVTCLHRGRAKDGTLLALCRAEGFDVGRNMVHTGWAVAAPGDPAGYGAVMAASRDKRRGMWRGTFEMPWDWRRRQ